MPKRSTYYGLPTTITIAVAIAASFSPSPLPTCPRLPPPLPSPIRYGLDGFGRFLPTAIYLKPGLDYTRRSTQSRLLALQSDATSLQRTTGPLESWLDDFLAYAAQDERWNATGLDADG